MKSCFVAHLMEKHEEYARGHLRLYPDYHAVEVAQYALDLLKLRHQHEERCPACKA